MRQHLLAGQTRGLRPGQRRQLDRLAQRRQPDDALAEPLSLQRLAAASQELGQPISLLVDGRGLCRLLWVGPLQSVQDLQQQLGDGRRATQRVARLITCVGRGSLEPRGAEAVVGLDLAPRLWLRLKDRPDAGGHWPAALFTATGQAGSPWQRLAADDLHALCASPWPPGDGESLAPAAPAKGREQVLLLALNPGDREQARRRITELEGLVRSAGGEPVGLVEQRRSQLNPQTLWGEGKLSEAALEARRLGATLVVTDRELTPSQVRNLERLLDLPVSDRSELILDIFAQRAASQAGRLQVELAQLRYRLPRLSGRGLSLSRQGGGIGTRGPGETQLEKDRRSIARRLERLQREVRQLGDHRARLRQGRRQLPRLALVGYTNAGKSSLLNSLSRAGEGKGVLAANVLFATLDPTTRRLELADAGGGPPAALLVTDTVGFIRDLPPQLLEAFRSTLEETLDADQLLLVVDLSDPAWPDHWQSVHTILDGLGSMAPRRMVANQIDRCPAEALDRARELAPDALFVSATAGLGLQHLRQELQQLAAGANPAELNHAAGA